MSHNQRAWMSLVLAGSGTVLVAHAVLSGTMTDTSFEDGSWLLGIRALVGVIMLAVAVSLAALGDED